MKTKMMIASALLALTTGVAMATPTIDVNTGIGPVVADEASGKTLYTFRKDRRGKSNCTGSCAASWPPFLVNGTAAANDGSKVIKRADGTLQWATAAGLPLYFWAGDSAAGDTKGDGVGGVWDAARR
ncbi:hypothetical protein MUY35_03600 [Aliiroseovarius sp. S1339]|uniref:COG4315 family predicted lipoprotein n=1 Tax=Aliiroseovarius sp. S1339 TaxID=2936990 RepID=UPI0020C14F24|nr:hypothetical protein [Aliiroseovarius sp. S1339]MCK8462931.1 hypothetical protein [Aliiroseovarius sp. S1339]